MPSPTPMRVKSDRTPKTGADRWAKWVTFYIRFRYIAIGPFGFNPAISRRPNPKHGLPSGTLWCGAKGQPVLVPLAAILGL